MYRLKLDKEQYERFKKMARIEMILQDISIKELSGMTNYNEQSLRGFFCKKNSKFIAYAIAKALDMEIKDYEA